MSIRTKILALILAGVLLTGVIGTLIGRTVATNALRDEAKANLEGIAQARSRAIRNMLSYQTQNIELLAAQANAFYTLVESGNIKLGLQPDNYSAMSAIMQGMIASNKYIWQALYLNKEGVVVAASIKNNGPDVKYQNDTIPTDWSKADYSKIDWTNIDPSKVDWSQVDFNKIDLSKIDLSKIDLSRIDWSKIDLSKIDVTKVDLGKIRWDTVDLSKVKWQSADTSQMDIYLKGKDAPYVGNLLLYKGSNKFILAVSAPFYSRGQLQGIMVYLGGEDELQAITTDKNGLGDTGEAYLLDQDGYMLTPSRFVENAVLRQHVALPDNLVQSDQAANIKTTSWTNYTGSKVFGVYQRIPDTGWTVVIEKNKSEVFAPVSDLTRKMIWSLLALVSCWAILALVFSKQISMPIVKLKYGAERIMQGDWSTDVSTNVRDEVGELSRVFSAMSVKLERSQEELQRYSSNLEKQVAARTKDLSDANEKLNQAREKLEKRVEERTRELMETNRALEGRINEREVLLKEIHHRVKNNLQIISSLLNLQKEGLKDEDSRVMFEDSGRRVRSMALIHEQLYRSGNLAQIDFTSYVRELSGNLLHSYNHQTQTIRLYIQGNNIFLGIDAAVPCGLIINEIITNSIKYAFPEGWEGERGKDISQEIRIELTRNNARELTILVADNGVGLSKEIDFRNTETLGLQLVASLADQLGATLDVSREGGTAFRIIIPEQGWKQGA